MHPDELGQAHGEVAPLHAPKPELGSLPMLWLGGGTTRQEVTCSAGRIPEGIWSRETTPAHEDCTPLLSPRSASSRSSSKESFGGSDLLQRRHHPLGMEIGTPAAGEAEVKLGSPNAGDEEQFDMEEVDPGSPSSLASRSHIDAWSDRNETLIIFDWDDTLCPTTCAMSDKDCALEPEDLHALQLHEQSVIEALHVAARIGHVVILSMACTGWITECIDRLMPGLHGLFDELDIQVVLAREGVPMKCKREAFAECREPSHFLKRRAMAQILREFYGGDANRPGCSPCRARSWKNILSIGDSAAERDALQDLVLSKMQRDRHGQWKECRCKTLKLVSEPGLEQLTAELCQVAQLLPALIHHDGDLDFELDGEDLYEAVPDFGHYPGCRSTPQSPAAFSE